MSAEPAPPRIAVLVFPGSNDDRDAALALERLGADPILVWHAERDLPDVGAVVLPGGFSYGDYLRCGAIARFAPVMEAVRRFADDGGLVLGICNGFQVLCEAGLLPGALRPNASLEFVCSRRRPADGARRHALHEQGRDRPDADHPDQARRGVLLRRRGAAGRARAERPGRPALRAEPERLGRLDRRRRERARERLRPDAAPRARGRPADRLDRRRDRARLARRRGSRAAAHGGLSPSASASAGRFASPSRRRSRSRPRRVTGPRRAVPPVV